MFIWINVICLTIYIRISYIVYFNKNKFTDQSNEKSVLLQSLSKKIIVVAKLAGNNDQYECLSVRTTDW